MTKTTLILTRPAASATRFADQLSDVAKARLKIIFSPLIEIVPLDVTVDTEGHAAVIFTSANGVSLAPDGLGRTAFCVGEKTAQAAAERGWQAQMAGPDAQGLIARLISHSLPGPLLHLGGVHQRGDIVHSLRSNGVLADAVALYDQRLLGLNAVAKTALASDMPCLLPVFSPRTAIHLAAEVAQSKAVTAIALSPAVAAPLATMALENLLILPAPNAREMLYCIEKLALRTSLA